MSLTINGHCWTDGAQQSTVMNMPPTINGHCWTVGAQQSTVTVGLMGPNNQRSLLDYWVIGLFNGLLGYSMGYWVIKWVIGLLLGTCASSRARRSSRTIPSSSRQYARSCWKWSTKSAANSTRAVPNARLVARCLLDHKGKCPSKCKSWVEITSKSREKIRENHGITGIRRSDRWSKRVEKMAESLECRA
jgi:hypothetical protein